MGKKLNFKKEVHNTSHNSGLFIGTSGSSFISSSWRPHIHIFLQRKWEQKEMKVKLSFPQNLYISLCREVRTVVISRIFLFVNFF